MNTYGMDLMSRRRRRRHSAEFKAAVIQECMRPGVSMAAVALAHSLNANMLRKWVIDAEHALPPAPKAMPRQDDPVIAPTFVPLALPAATVEGEILEMTMVGACGHFVHSGRLWQAVLTPRSGHDWSFIAHEVRFCFKTESSSRAMNGAALQWPHGFKRLPFKGRHVTHLL